MAEVPLLKLPSNESHWTLPMISQHGSGNCVTGPQWVNKFWKYFVISNLHYWNFPSIRSKTCKHQEDICVCTYNFRWRIFYYYIIIIIIFFRKFIPNGTQSNIWQIIQGWDIGQSVEPLASSNFMHDSSWNLGNSRIFKAKPLAAADARRPIRECVGRDNSSMTTSGGMWIS